MPRSQMTVEQAAEPRFAVFLSPVWGFRALAIILLNYENLHGLHTVSGIIDRWAPASENDTAAYIKAVAAALHVGPDDSIDVHEYATLMSLCRAISIHECGGWMFEPADLAAGVQAALGV